MEDEFLEWFRRITFADEKIMRQRKNLAKKYKPNLVTGLSLDFYHFIILDIHMDILFKKIVAMKQIMNKKSGR